MAVKTRDGVLTLPALRGKQGSRTVYTVMPSNKVMNNFIPTEMVPEAERSQRNLDPKHADDIAEYITSNPGEYALGALSYAVNVEGEFEPFKDEDGEVLNENIGWLKLPLDADIKSVDGQHRRHGIKKAIDELADIGLENTVIVIYVERDLAKRRQIFSDMNWYVRPVNKSVNVGFDTRDPFARATQFMTKSHKLLRGRVEQEKNISKGSTSVITLGVLYDVLRRYSVGGEGRLPRGYKAYDEKDIINSGNEFLELLMSARPEFQRVIQNPDETPDVRATTILLNGTTLKMLASAVYQARANGYDLEHIRKQLVKVPFTPDAAIWQNSGFVAPEKTTPSARNQEVRAAMNALVEVIGPAREQAA